MKAEDPDIFHFLISHPEFRDWVLNPNPENEYFWRKWIETHQENLFDVKKAKEFIQRLRFQEEMLSPGELDEILGKVLAKEKPVYPSPVQTWLTGSFLLLHWRKMAAVLIFTAVAAGFIYGFLEEVQPAPDPVQVEWVSLENPKGRKSRVTLPDGSVVNLNYESRLKFPKSFVGEIRSVELEGEAFFDVVFNDTLPFMVTAGGVDTKVLGTSFNIRSFAGERETQISLVTGRIKVHKTGKAMASEEVYLDPGEQLRINRKSGKMLKESFDMESVTAWKQGILLFKDADFEEFVDQLEKWYGVDFQIYGRPSKKWMVNGRYQNEKLDDILVGLKFVYGLEYRIQGRNVILKFEL